jgi:hypothetical protein
MRRRAAGGSRRLAAPRINPDQRLDQPVLEIVIDVINTSSARYVMSPIFG